MPKPEPTNAGAVTPAAKLPRAGTSQLVHSLRIALMGCLGTGILAVVLEAVVLITTPGFQGAELSFPIIALLYFAAGVRAWWARPGSFSWDR